MGQFLSKARHAQALAEWFGTPVSQGTVAAVTTRAAEKLEGFLAQITDRLVAADVVGFDETGLRVAGALHWVHCARTDRYTLIACCAHALRELQDVTDTVPEDGWCRATLCHLARSRRRQQATCAYSPELVRR